MRQFAALLQHRDLLWLWTLREVQVRYKQSMLGIAWAVLQPLALTIIFTLVFSRLVQVDTGGIPYPIFSYTALVPWTFFATSLSFGIASLVNNMNLVTKIYFPREILPLASIGAAFVDFLVSAVDPGRHDADLRHETGLGESMDRAAADPSGRIDDRGRLARFCAPGVLPGRAFCRAALDPGVDVRHADHLSSNPGACAVSHPVFPEPDGGHHRRLPSCVADGRTAATRCPGPRWGRDTDLVGSRFSLLQTFRAGFCGLDMNKLPVGAVVFDGVSKRYQLGALGTLRSTVEGLTSRRRGHAVQDFWALRDVSFRVEPGESLGLIGPNGAGKTTTLKLLSNITQPTAGHVHVAGRTSSLIELGAGFHPELSGRDNIFLNGAILGLKRREIQRKLDGIIAFSELERFMDTPVKRYSSGMYVRLGFAVAAHVEPDVLLVDEVLAVGDASFRHRCMQRMQALQQSGTTILFVSHNMHMVRRMCSRAVLLSGGRVCAQGLSTDVIAEYEKALLSAAEPAQSAAWPDGNGESSALVRLTDVTVAPSMASTDGASAPIDSDSCATIRVQYRAQHAQTVGRIDVKIIREDGMLCSTIDGPADPNSTDPSLDELGEQGEIRIVLARVQLTTGRYFALVQVTDSTDEAVIASGQSEYFTVFTQHTVPNPGIFVPHSTWEHHRLA